MLDCMSWVERVLAQRSEGRVDLRVEGKRTTCQREQGAAKVRLSSGNSEAILINTGGGLAGGDVFHFDISVSEGTSLCVTTQAAEKVYRTLGPPAVVSACLGVGARAAIHWLPQETIVFNNASLTRRLSADLEFGASLLAVESIVFGRVAMGESIQKLSLRDRWRIRCGGKLVFADDIAIEETPSRTSAALGEACAMATLVFISSRAQARLEDVRNLIGPTGGASAWDGKLVARLLAIDGFALRKSLVPVLNQLIEGAELPKVWSL